MTETDEEFIRDLREPMTGLRLHRPVESVTARGRTVRRYRRTLAITAAVTVLALGSAVAAGVPTGWLASRPPAGWAVSGQAHPAGAASPSPSSTPVVPDVHVNKAAWTVDSRSDGSVDVTIRDFADLDQLTAILSRAGVRARVQVLQRPPLPRSRSGQPTSLDVCEQDQPALHGIDKIMEFVPLPAHSADTTVMWRLHPDRMPPGTYVSIIAWRYDVRTAPDGSSDDQTSLTLVQGEPWTCVPKRIPTS
jgi:hypothetical protein